MADEKVRHAFDGSPLPPYSEAVLDEPSPEPYADTTRWATRDGRWAVEEEDGQFYLVDDAGTVLRDQPISEDQLA